MLFSHLLHAQDGFSPLYFASQNGHTEVVDVLLQAGADVHQAVAKYVCHYLHSQVIDMFDGIHMVGHYFFTLKKQTVSNPVWKWKHFYGREVCFCNILMHTCLWVNPGVFNTWLNSLES